MMAGLSAFQGYRGHQDRHVDRSASRLPPARLARPATRSQPYAGRFTVRQAAHLLRRAGFGGSADDVARSAALGHGRRGRRAAAPERARRRLRRLPGQRRCSTIPRKRARTCSSGGSTACCARTGRWPRRWRCSGTATSRRRCRRCSRRCMVRADRPVPRAGPGPLSGAALGGDARSGDADLARQPLQLQGARQRELRARGDGAVRAGPGQLHRGRRQGSRARVHRLDASTAAAAPCSIPSATTTGPRRSSAAAATSAPTTSSRSSSRSRSTSASWPASCSSSSSTATPSPS